MGTLFKSLKYTDPQTYIGLKTAQRVTGNEPMTQGEKDREKRRRETNKQEAINATKNWATIDGQPNTITGGASTLG